jgi:serine/threonine-protein kinase
MKESWLWIGKYLIVILVALLLGSVLAELEPFKSTTLGAARIGAGTLAQFVAHSGALALLWALGFCYSTQLRRVGGATGPLSATVLALVTLIVVASAYGVLSRFIAPVLRPNLKPVVDWVFIAGILAAALWLLWVLFTDSEALIEAVRSVVADKRRPPLPQDDRAML